MSRKPFPQISPAAWEHPSDRAAYSLIRQIPGIDQVIEFLGGMTTDKAMNLLFQGNAILTSPMQIPRVHRAMAECARILDVTPVPQVFVTNSPLHNAMAVGTRDPFVVIHSSMVKDFSEEELLKVLGHELAHIKARHTTYQTLLHLLLNAGFQVLPIDPVIKIPLILALLDWQRKSEISCDRAGLLCIQNPTAAYQFYLKVIAGGLAEETDMNELLTQAENFEKVPHIGDSITKFLNTMDQNHPPLVERFSLAKKWVDSGEYQKILDGNYVMMGQEGDPGLQVKTAFDSWRQELRESQDPGAQAVSQILDQAQNTASELERFFKGLL